MKRNLGSVNWIKASPSNKSSENVLKIFHYIKKGKESSVDALAEKAMVAEKTVKQSLDFLKEKNVLDLVENKVRLNKDCKKVLGVGFAQEKVILTVMNLRGEGIAKEQIEISPIQKLKGRKKEIKEIVKKIKSETKLRGHDFFLAVIAMPQRIEDFDIGAPDTIAETFVRLFKCNVFLSKEVTAVGYGEKQQVKDEENVIYVHSDVGSGIIVQDETILQAKEGVCEKTSYLRPWNQYDLVNMTKNLIKKGVGTDVVKMVGGDMDKITLDVILEAAEKQDELANDLVKRSALALGVRTAYLVNVYKAPVVILGGGIENKEGGFSECMKESATKFLCNSVSGKFKILSGTLGSEASSIGAAELGRRQLFIDMEV